MKKQLRNVFVLVLSLVLLLNSTTYAWSISSTVEIPTLSWEDKIDPLLTAKVQETAEDKIPVWLWMEDIDEGEVEKEVTRRTGLRESDLSVIDESLSEELTAKVANLGQTDTASAAQIKSEFQAYLERTQAARALEKQQVDIYLQELRAVQNEMHLAKNAQTFSQLNLSEKDIIFLNTRAPVYVVRLCKDEIYRLAKHPKVTGIYYYDTDEIEIPEGNTMPEVMNGSTIGRIRSDVGLTGSGVKIGIIDSGKVEPGDEIAASRITYVTPSSEQFENHSTIVARVAAGSNGVAPNASIYSSSGSLRQGITNLSDAGVSVANYSMGSDRQNIPYTSTEKYVDYLVHSERFSLVKSAGNDNGVITSPGLSYNIITVGGFYNQGTSNQNDDQMYGGSNYNHLSGCNKPDFVADQTFGGTSLAAPFVTGTIALLFELRPSLKTQPEAVKAILMASCHRKVLPAGNDPVELITSGITDHQGAGAIDPYIAISIAGSGHYGVRISSGIETFDSIPFVQPAYGSTGLNVSVAWSSPNTLDSNQNAVEVAVDMDAYLYQGLPSDENLIGTSAIGVSSAEMIYVTPSATDSLYALQVHRYSVTSADVRYAYAFSVNDTRYQYTSQYEGVFFIKNKATGKYLTRLGSMAVQNDFSGADTQKWLITNGVVHAITSDARRLSAGTVSGDYTYTTLNSSDGISLLLQSRPTATRWDGSISFRDTENNTALGIYQDSSNANVRAAWSAYSANNLYQQWYLEPVVYQRGDVNCNGVVDITDSQMVSNYMVNSVTLSDLQLYLADANGDNVVNMSDVTRINNIVSGTIG